MSHLLLVSADFYPNISSELLHGAQDHLRSDGHTFDHISVPGAFEIPAAIRIALTTKRYDGFVALGCVIRGETTHYDYVCGECARGLQELAINHMAAIGFGVLTVENMEQATRRASVTQGNKGKDAAEAALKMIALKQQCGVVV